MVHLQSDTFGRLIVHEEVRKLLDQHLLLLLSRHIVVLTERCSEPARPSAVPESVGKETVMGCSRAGR